MKISNATLLGIGRRFKRGLRLIRFNREFLVFLVFLIVAIVFWFVQSFKGVTTVSLEYELELTNVPHNIIITSEIPERVTATVSGRGFSLLQYILNRQKSTVSIEFSDLSLNKKEGSIVIDNGQWKRTFSKVLPRSIGLVSCNPSGLEVYYCSGQHKKVSVMYAGKATAGNQFFLCDTEVLPEYIDLYAPTAQLDTITTVYTEAKDFLELEDTTRVRLALKKINGVKFVPDSIDVRFCVDLYTDRTLKVPIYSQNVPQNMILRTFPINASVTFNVSDSQAGAITADDFLIVVDYESVKKEDKKCRLKILEKPKSVINVRVTPELVDYVIEMSDE